MVYYILKYGFVSSSYHNTMHNKMLTISAVFLYLYTSLQQQIMDVSYIAYNSRIFLEELGIIKKFHLDIES